MKKLMVIVMACCCSIIAQAQLIKGSKVLGGGISYYRSSSTDYLDTKVTSSSLTFGPSFGYFVADDLAVGINLIFQSEKDEGSVLGDDKYSAFGVGPFVRYYKHTSNENFKFLVQGAFTFISGKDDPAGTVNPDVKSSRFDVAVSPGFAYFFNQHWAAELMFRGIGVTFVDPDKDADNDNVTFVDIGLNSLSPSIGVRYHFK